MYKIFFIEPKPDVYGGQHALIARCLALKNKKIPFSIIHPYKESAFIKKIEESKIQEHLIKAKSNNAKILRYAFIIKTIMHIKKATPNSIIHCEGFDSAYLASIMSIFINPFPYLIFTIRSERYNRFTLIDKILLSRFNKILTNSEYSKKRIYSKIKRDDIDVLYSPIKLKQMTIKTDTDKLSVGYVGSIEPRKRLDRFIDRANFTIQSIEKNSGELKNIEYKIFGEVKNKQGKKFLDSTCKSIKDNSKFTFLGYQNIEKIIKEIDILYCPFDDEPLGRVIPEFLYSGVVVIIEKNGGMREAGCEYAIPIEGKDNSTQNINFMKILNDYEKKSEDLKRKLPEIQKKIKDRFSSKIITDLEIEIYCKASSPIHDKVCK